MTDKSYINWVLLSDEAIEMEIGLYIKKARQQQSKTQQEIAKAANISRSTLSLLERGESGSLKTLIQVLRVLDKLQLLQVFKFEEPVSPLALAKAQQKSRERVRQTKEPKAPYNREKSSW